MADYIVFVNTDILQKKGKIRNLSIEVEITAPEGFEEEYENSGLLSLIIEHIKEKYMCNPLTVNVTNLVKCN